MKPLADFSLLQKLRSSLPMPKSFSLFYSSY